MTSFRNTIFQWPRKSLPTIQPATETSPALPHLYSEAQEILYSVTTVFPFVLFPDKLIIRPNHVDVIVGLFFGSGTSTRIQIQDIRQVTLQYNPFFAKIEIIPQGPLEQTLLLNYLPKQQAMWAKRLISGLIECHQKNVDFSKYSKEQLLAYLKEIGKSRE